MTSAILIKLGIFNPDISLKVSQYKSHGTYGGKYFNTAGIFKGIINDSHSALCEEYIATLFHTLLFACILYFTLTTLSYLYFFKWKKQKFLPKYDGHLFILHDIKWSVINILVESLLVAGLRMTLSRWSFVYFRVEDYGYFYLILSVFFHICFDETFTYWIHRVFHTNRFLYDYMHKIHHKSVDVTPFSAFAFHPLDAFGQALPTFVSCFFFPLHYNILLFFSLVTTIWSVSIHDNVPVLPCKLFLYSTHHTIHHEVGIGKFRNYGKFTTVWDRLAGTYADPDKIDFGWIRNESVIAFFKYLNKFVDQYIPDNTPRTKKTK